MRTPSSPEDYFIPELFEEVPALSSQATTQEIIEHINLLTGVVNLLIQRSMGVHTDEITQTENP